MDIYIFFLYGVGKVASWLVVFGMLLPGATSWRTRRPMEAARGQRERANQRHTPRVGSGSSSSSVARLRRRQVCIDSVYPRIQLT